MYIHARYIFFSFLTNDCVVLIQPLLFFLNLKEYKLAQFHCYGRYLTKHIQRGLTLGEAAELDADTFYKTHLSNGFDDMNSATMVVGVQCSCCGSILSLVQILFSIVLNPFSYINIPPKQRKVKF